LQIVQQLRSNELTSARIDEVGGSTARLEQLLQQVAFRSQQFSVGFCCVTCRILQLGPEWNS
jgi:hypothetical protein